MNLEGVDRDVVKEALLIEGHTKDHLSRPEGTYPKNLEKYPRKVVLYAGSSDDSNLEKLFNILKVGQFGVPGVATMSNLSGTSSTPFSFAGTSEAFGLVLELAIPGYLVQREAERRDGTEVYYELSEPDLKKDDIKPLYPTEPNYGTYIINPKFISGAWFFDNSTGDQRKIYFLGTNSDDCLRNLSLFKTID